MNSSYWQDYDWDYYPGNNGWNGGNMWQSGVFFADSSWKCHIHEKFIAQSYTFGTIGDVKLGSL